MKRHSTDGQASATIRHLSAMYSEWIDWGAVDKNPCQGVRLFTYKSRDRYVTDEELEAFIAYSPEKIAAYTLFKWLTGIRKSDILRLELIDFKEDGLHIQPNKTKDTTGKKQIIEWTPALRESFNRLANIRRPKVQRLDRWKHLICTNNGLAYTYDGFNSLWQRAQTNAVEAGVLERRFWDSDIRAKSSTDISLDHATKLLNHADPRTTKAHYRRKPERVKPVK